MMTLHQESGDRDLVARRGEGKEKALVWMKAKALIDKWTI
jgi:hypothetical protein